MIKVLLVDDHEIVRVVLRQIFERVGDMQVVAMASDGQEAVHEAVTQCPDVVVMDISMPIMDGIEAARQIYAKCPETRVLMISAYNTPHYIRHSIDAGALGYILKDNISHDLVTAVRTLHRGEPYFSKQIAELANSYIQAQNGANDVRDSDSPKSSSSNILFIFFACVTFVQSFI